MTQSDTTTAAETARTVVTDIADRFERAWNDADGPAYAEPFAVDADYITIQGAELAGRDEIAAGASEIFSTIYRGSTISLRVTGVRCLSPSVIVAQIGHVLDVPSGPLAGVSSTVATVVVTETTGGWEVMTLHNTVIMDPAQAN